MSDGTDKKLDRGITPPLESTLREKALHQIIESRSRDVEERIFQMSQIRLVAETMGEELGRAGFFERTCIRFNEVFHARLSVVYWYRKNAPEGWWLGSWHGGGDGLSPDRSIILKGESPLIDRVIDKNTPLHLEQIEPDPLFDMWRLAPESGNSALLFPMKTSEIRSGLFLILDPLMKLRSEQVQPHLEILQRLINTGVNNRLYYKRLDERREEFYDLFENSSDMVVVAYRDGVVRDCNSQFLRTMQHPGEPRGEAVHALFEEVDRPVFEEVWQQLLAGEEVRNVDLRLRRRDGQELEVELAGNFRTDGEGNPGVIRLYLRDVTERRRQERRQHELELQVELARQRHLAQVGLYTSGIVHNLKNPVQLLMGNIQLMRLGRLGNEALDVLERSTQRIMNIIENLLGKMRDEANTDATAINLNHLLINELNFLNANQYYKHSVEKVFDFCEEMPEVQGVYGDFSQAIMNVVYNALDAMQEAERRLLTIKTSYDEVKQSVVVSITDTGCGIDEQDRDRIFDPFYSTKSRNNDFDYGIASGSGLGLSSSQLLLGTYGATISFDTEPEQGTTFTISIPVGEAGS